MQNNIPTKFSWVLAENCTCPVVENFCYRPEAYTKPLVCVHSSIMDIGKYLERPSSESFFWIYFILFAIMAIQFCSILVYGMERVLFIKRGKQQLKRKKEENIFAPDLRPHCRKSHRPITKKEIGPPLPLHCRVTKERVEVHELKEMGIEEKKKISGKEIKEEVKRTKL